MLWGALSCAQWRGTLLQCCVQTTAWRRSALPQDQRSVSLTHSYPGGSGCLLASLMHALPCPALRCPLSLLFPHISSHPPTLSRARASAAALPTPTHYTPAPPNTHTHTLPACLPSFLPDVGLIWPVPPALCPWMCPLTSCRTALCVSGTAAGLALLLALVF